MASFAPRLASIAARPPTPPKESTAKASPNNGFETNPAGHGLLDTPDESPSSSADYSKDSAGKAQKKVGFTLLGTQYHRFSVGGHESDSDGQIRQLPRSRDCKSSKSILKACTGNVRDSSSNELLAFDNTNLPAMLRSTTRHLASGSRSSRLDAYSTLLACLSAYEEIPEAHELAEKVAEIAGHIRRDIMANNVEDGGLDIQLATQALKLTTIFLCTARVATVLPEDFCSFVLERSISSLEDQALPKILVSHYMHLLEKQKCLSRYMTTDRVNRLISALDGVTVWVKGNRIVGHRLMIYQRLLGQAKLLMVSRVTSWIDHLISGMLSTMKDIRARAINFGLDASSQLGNTTSVSQACIVAFNRVSADGTKVVDILSSRLIEMANSKEDGSHVPQIWSVVILFLRSRRRQLEGWEHLKAWLVVIQQCFNSSDGQTKLQANIAWNRLIFAINLDTSTSNSVAKMLRQPIVSQLERRSSDKSSKVAKQIARSSYCTLLYYALRPTATHTQLDQYWDLYVYQILPSCFTGSKSDTDHACDILSALCSGKGKLKIWEDNRVNDRPINPEDLPSLDPKWVRLRTAKILQVLDKLFDVADWQLSKEGDAPIVQTWRSFTSALGNAGGKEVKVSMEALTSVAHIINEFKSLLERSSSRLTNERHALSRNTPSEADQLETFEKIRVLVIEAVSRIGNLPFLERRLVRSSQDSFEPAVTPSSRSSRDSGSLDSAITHLLNILLKNAPHTSTATSYIDTLKTVLNISLQSATSRRTQLSILRNFGRLLTLDGGRQKEASVLFWRLLAERTSLALKQSHQNETHNDSPQYPGQEFREAVKILELGLQLQSTCNGSVWNELYTNIIDALRKDVGNEAISLVIIEPLAELMSRDDTLCDDLVLTAATSMLETVQWPQSLHLLERVHRRLWGMDHAGPKIPSLDPCDKLYSMVKLLLKSSYASLELLPSATAVKFVSATTKMISSCPPEFAGTVFSRIQKGLAPWIEDAKGILGLRPSSPLRLLYSEINKLWTTVVKLIEQLSVFDTRCLFSIQELVIAGFRSRHKRFVNESIAMWNKTFGIEGALEYPEDLRTILQKLRCMTELSLPNFPDETGEEIIFSSSHFVDSQDEEELQLEPVVSPARLPTSVGSLQGIAESEKSVRLSADFGKAAAFQRSPASARRGAKTTPKARLRHDDSQIQFAAIESSPLQSEPVESQYLTDRQKEVKERQGREAAVMFPEIRSSPRSASRPLGYVLPKLVFKSPQDSASKSAYDQKPGPTYSPDALMDEFLGSSPTPSSKSSSHWRSNHDLPSSPPLMSPQLKNDHLTDAPLEDEHHAHGKANTEENTGNQFADENSPSMNGRASNSETISAGDEDMRLVNDHKETSNLETEQVAVDAHPVSDLDVYVNVPSVSPLDEASAEHGDIQSNDVANSFQSEDSSHFSVEDDQVTAQLMTEMERASSQSAQKDKSAPSARGATKKRKRTTGSSVVDNKKKRTSATSDSLAAAKVPRTVETVAECVLIDVREVDRSSPVLSKQIKREPSASPPIVMSNQVMEEIDVVEKPLIDHPMNSEANQSLDQRQDMPITAKKAVGRPRGSRNSQVKREESQKEQASALRKSTRVVGRLNGPTTSSPHSSPAASQESTKGGQWFAFGKTPGRPGRSMFRWLQRSSAESEDLEGSSSTAPCAHEKDGVEINGHTNLQDLQRGDLPPVAHDSEHRDRRHNEGLHPENEQRDGEAQAEGCGGDQRKDEATSASGILARFQRMLDEIKGATLKPEEERAVVGVLFECVKEVHEAGRRHTSM